MVQTWSRIHLLLQETQGAWVQFLGQEDVLEKEMAPHSSILAWKNPQTQGPSGLVHGVEKSQIQLSTSISSSVKKPIKYKLNCK